MPKREKPTGGKYDIGYGKPPKNTQFKKGQPRPPRRTDKVDKPEMPNLSAYIAEELSALVSFNDEEGKRRRMTKAQVLAKRLVNEALKTGNPKQLRDFLPKAAAAANDDYSEADLEIIARFLAQHGPRGGSDEPQD